MFAFRNNRRTQPRAPVRLTAEVVWNGRDVESHVLLISEGGCFLEIDPTPPKDSRLKLTIDIPGRGPHTTEIHVRYAAHSGDYRGQPEARGVGCQFVTISSTTKQAIRELIAQVKKSYTQIQFELALAKPNSQLPAMIERAQLPPLRDRRALQDAIQWGLKQMGS